MTVIPVIATTSTPPSMVVEHIVASPGYTYIRVHTELLSTLYVHPYRRRTHLLFEQAEQLPPIAELGHFQVVLSMDNVSSRCVCACVCA